MRLPRLVLASTSPRRADLLRGLGLRVQIVAPDVEEHALHGESPAEHALRLAASKALGAARGLDPERGEALVLGADTIVALDGAVLSKPADERDAQRMLRLLAGRTHEVHTAVHLLRTDDGRSVHVVETSRVHFRPYDAPTIRWYVGTGETSDKAGAYSIQGLGALLSRGIEGSFSNVVGLPLEILPDLFSRIGVDLFEILRQDGDS